MDELVRLEARIEALYGGGIDWSRATGVVHVAAIEVASRAVLALGPGAPASETDRFVLGFARARADAIVTTGAILRAEPHLVHRFAEAPEVDAAWGRFRVEVLGRTEPPTLVVLSAGADWRPGHPALRGAKRTVVLTTAAGRARLVPSSARPVSARPAIEQTASADGRGGPVGPTGPVWSRAAGRSTEVVVLEDEPQTPSADPLTRAIDWLRRKGGCETIVLESGPRSTLGSYTSTPPRIDELLLSIFEGRGCPVVDAPRFPDPATLETHFGPALGRTAGVGGRAAPSGSDAGQGQPLTRRRIEEPSGAWVFERYRRIIGQSDGPPGMTSSSTTSKPCLL